MDIVILSLLSVIAFCACSFILIRTIQKPIPRFQKNEYSRVALKLKKNYAVFSWTLLTGFFLLAVCTSFLEVYRQL